MRAKVKLNLSRVDSRIKKNIELSQYALSEQVLKDSNQYVPADTWALRNSSLTSSKPDEGKLIWNTPYARRLYYGVGYNFSKDKNMNASAEWFEKARGVHRKQWLELADKTIRRGK